MEYEASQQVWQRVFSSQSPKREDLQPLLLSAREAAAAFRHLASILTGPGKEQAQRLYRSQQETLSCLEGLQLLSGSAGKLPKPMPVPREPAAALLKRAFYRSKAAVTEYTARSLDADFGTVFRYLAQEEEARCAAIAGLLGSLGGNK